MMLARYHSSYKWKHYCKTHSNFIKCPNGSTHNLIHRRITLWGPLPAAESRVLFGVTITARVSRGVIITAQVAGSALACPGAKSGSSGRPSSHTIFIIAQSQCSINLISNQRLFTVTPVVKTTWEIGTTLVLRTATSVPRLIQHIELDLRNKTTSGFRTVFHSTFECPYFPGSTVLSI